MAVPPIVFVKFFREATAAMESFQPEIHETPPRLSEQRRSLLGVQLVCLKQVVASYNDESKSSGSTLSLEQAQEGLKKLGKKCNSESVQEAMDAMNDTARLSFCRVVIEAEYRWAALKRTGDAVPRQLRNEGDGPMERSVIEEFCGLCCAMVRLPNVQKYLRDGTPLLDVGEIGQDESEPSSALSSSVEDRFILAQKRLEEIQKLLLRAVGCHPDYATAEVLRIFLTPHAPGSAGNEYSQDEELHNSFSKTVGALSLAATNAAIEGPSGSNELLSDHHEGGVTRILSVSHSEKIIESGDAWKGGAAQSKQDVGAGAAPSHETMEQQTEEHQFEQLRLARETATLQQNILNELMSMTEPDRDESLKVAKEAHDTFLKGALEIPAGTKRIDYLTSIDSSTQHLLVMHKLWTSIQEKNGRVPPTAQNQT